MTAADLPPELLKLLKTVRGKRARIVVDHILQHGFITSEDLETQYGYSHPPRAIRDVRDQGIPIETYRVKNAEGRGIAAYRFGDVTQMQRGRAGGRRGLPKKMKTALIQETQSRCAICGQTYEDQLLQIDHRIPYAIGGEPENPKDQQAYMVLCGSCNRTKSWSCERCQNQLEFRQPTLCQTCYWAAPQQYEHIALHPIRRLDLVWSGDAVQDYVYLVEQARMEGISPQAYVKRVLKRKGTE